VAGYAVTFSVVDNATKNIDAINRRMQQLRAPVERMQKSVQRFVDVSGLKKVAEGFEWVGRAASGALRTMLTMIPAMGAITGAASIAGMAKLVSSWADWGKVLRVDADRLGITTRQLDNLQNSARLTGASAQDMSEALTAIGDAAARAMRGEGGMVAWFNRAGIAWKDVNGQLKTGAQLLPEVYRYLDSLKNPMDRATASAALLGAEQSKVYLAYRQSGLTIDQYLEKGRQVTALTNEQIASLRDWSTAQDRAGVAFDALGRQIGVVLARNFTPLLNHLLDFVDKNTPAIVAAVDRISAKFAAWLEGVKWDDIERGINSVMAGFKTIIDNLDTITTAAEVVAVLFATKWAIGIVASIAKVATALGTVGTGASGAGGIGLLGKLGMIGALVEGAYLLLDKVLPAVFGDRPLPLARPPGPDGTPQTTPNASRGGNESGVGPHHGLEPSRPGGGGHGGGPRMPAPAAGPSPGAIPSTAPGPLGLSTGQTQREAGVRDRLATDLGLTADQASGIVGNLSHESDGLQAINERNPVVPGSRGGFGWAQWTGPRRVAFEAYAKEHNLDVKSDEANYGYLLKELRSPEYANMLERLRQQTGPGASAASASIVQSDYERPADPNASLADRQRRAARIAATAPTPIPPPATAAVPATALAPPAPPTAAAPGEGYKVLSKDELEGPSAPAATMPARQDPITGQVDISIRNLNPPPNQSVTASGSGAARVSPPRVEYGSLATI
jgi:hypothetical protein